MEELEKRLLALCKSERLEGLKINRFNGSGDNKIYGVDNVKETIIRQPDGRYVVQPMFKKDSVPLKNNYILANIRYRSFMKSLHK